ncbi:MAG: UxaA family hydrolase [Sulfolobales archaeon]|nr:UxaA family hydrolase [Sulfolobales archaeon]
MVATKYVVRAYERPNGDLGIRNHVMIIPVDDPSGTLASNITKILSGTKAIPHPYGRLQFGKDLEVLFDTLIGYGSNPNVAASIVIGLDSSWSNKVADKIAKTGKPVEAFGIEGYGDLRTLERAARKAKEYVQFASELRRTEVDLSGFTFSIKCGESDTTSGIAANPALGYVTDKLYDLGNTILFGETSELTGAEDVVAERIPNPALKEKFLKIYRDYISIIESSGLDLLGSQPTEGNIRGGISTIEEKALGTIQKLGSRPVACVLDYLENVPKGGGGQLCFLNSPSASAEFVTFATAKGSVLNFFTTGQGNIVGNPISPVIKVTANPKTAKNMEEHIDVDISDLLQLKVSLMEAGERILNYSLRVMNGRLTSNEVMVHEEFSPIKLHITA